jgi:hypothetical protein
MEIRAVGSAANAGVIAVASERSAARKADVIYSP